MFPPGKIHGVTAHHRMFDELRIVDDDTSPARLHGEACLHCGSTTPPLLPAGLVGTRVSEGIVREWPVVACRKHTQVAE